MKRLRKRFATLCLAAAALLAVAIGAGLPRIQHYSADLVARLFPVTYQVTYRGADARPFTAPVRFTSEAAIVIAGEASGNSIPLSDVVFVCLQNELRTQNMLRSGLLAAAIVSMAALLPIALAATALMVAMPRARGHARRRSAAVSRHPAGCAQPRPVIPSVA